MAVGPLTAAQTSAGFTYQAFYSFIGDTDGAQPAAALVRDAHGNLYGTTQYAGDLAGCVVGSSTGCGTVFRIDPSGNYAVLYAFTGGTDGASPMAGLLRDAEGNLYGTTTSGGAGFGVVFMLDPMGNEHVLHTFNGADGDTPTAGLIMDSEGNLYGTTLGGGNLQCSRRGCGVVFKIDHSTGQESILYAFNGSDGRLPSADLIRDEAGNLYGTTFIGGANNYGVVFRVDPDGHETVLHDFTGGTDGARSTGALIRDDEGNLYGTTNYGGNVNECVNGADVGCGVVFKLDRNGIETVLYTFTGGSDGATPFAGVMRDHNGNLYGTTIAGGGFYGALCAGFGCGVVFKLDQTGQQTVLYTFEGGADGGNPFGGLIEDSNGKLYGAATLGGNFYVSQGWCATLGCGVVFEISACRTARCQGQFEKR